MEDKVMKTMLKEKDSMIKMSRVPGKTKEAFLALAEDEFCGDYGMTLKFVLDGYLQYRIYFENMDMKLDQIISAQQIKTEEKTDGKRLMSGRIVGQGGGDDE